jgi:hypothetical protein
MAEAATGALGPIGLISADESGGLGWHGVSRAHGYWRHRIFAEGGQAPFPTWTRGFECMPCRKGRKNVFVIPRETPLNIDGRLVNLGTINLRHRLNEVYEGVMEN